MSEDFRFERVIAARPEEVFDAFTSPEGQRELYGKDESGWVVKSSCELRIGGTWVIDFGASPTELYRHEHVFKEIERPRRIRLTTTETRLDGAKLVTGTLFTFEARGEQTLMTMIGTGFPTKALRDEHTLGLPTSFARLERFVLRGGGA